MEIKKILHMNNGEGEFGYVNNNDFQIGVFYKLSKPLVESAINSILSNNTVRPSQVLNVVDMGCGNGALPTHLVTLVLETVQRTCRDELKLDDSQVPEIQIYLNDLPTNDFNSVFRNSGVLQLREAGENGPLCFVMGAPGSFYDRLFPRNSLHLVHTNYSLHWLSQVPPSIYNEEGVSTNKGNIVPCERSPPTVEEAYRAQFSEDLTRFLHCRSCELVPGGYMVLAIKGFQYVEPNVEEYLCQAIISLVSKGVIKEEKLDTFDFPMYCSKKEVVEGIIHEEGSYIIEKLEEVFDKEAFPWDKQKHAYMYSKCLRAFTEPLVSSHFGEEVCDALYDEQTQLILNRKVQPGQKEGIASIIAILRKRI